MNRLYSCPLAVLLIKTRIKKFEGEDDDEHEDELWRSRIIVLEVPMDRK
jgi:hypothetical protein